MTGDVRDPVIWLLLAIVARGIAEIVAFGLLDQDLLRHGQAEAGGHEPAVIYGRPGRPVPFPDPGQVKRPDNDAAPILAAIVTLGSCLSWWYHTQRDQPNTHVASTWAHHDHLVTAAGPAS